MSQLFTPGGQSTGVPASTSVLPVNTQEYPGLISFRMDWLDLLAVLGTLKSLLQHHSSKASILLCSAFLIVQLSHPYMTIDDQSQVGSFCFGIESEIFSVFLPFRVLEARLQPILGEKFLPFASRSRCLQSVGIESWAHTGTNTFCRGALLFQQFN